MGGRFGAAANNTHGLGSINQEQQYFSPAVHCLHSCSLPKCFSTVLSTNLEDRGGGGLEEEEAYRRRRLYRLGTVRPLLGTVFKKQCILLSACPVPGVPTANQF